jgi:hypothetical protein
MFQLPLKTLREFTENPLESQRTDVISFLAKFNGKCPVYSYRAFCCILAFDLFPPVFEQKEQAYGRGEHG